MSEAPQRTMLHIQVTGNPTPERLQQVAELFSKAAHDPNGAVLTTPDDVTIFTASLPADQQVVPIQVVGILGPEIIAQLTYEVNRAYCTSIGDNSFPNDWANADEHQKNINRTGVQNHLRNPSLTPQQSHQAWMRSKLADGWTYGPVKDAEKKTHPAMVPYEGLPPEQKVKDYLFKAVVETLRAQLPAPAMNHRAVEVYIPATQQWVPGKFEDLQVNYIWRFADTPDQSFLAQSEPYVNYTDRATEYTIKAAPVQFGTQQDTQENTQEPARDEATETRADESGAEPDTENSEHDLDFAGRSESDA